MNVKKDIRFRVYIAFTCICLFGIAILLKAATIQIKEGPELRELAREMHTDTTTLEAERGNIYTETGMLLCSSIPEFDVHIDFSVISKKLFDSKRDTLAICLSDLFKNGTPAQYRQILQNAYDSGYRYYALARSIPYYQYQQVRTFPIFNKGKGYGGFIEDARVKRINPYGMLAYRTIGLYRENSQTIGLEAKYDTVLTGINGSCVVQKQTGGVRIPIEGSEIEPQNGKDVVTTIDVSIQDVAEHALMSVLQQYECMYGTCVVMEVQTGKIRALVNLGRQKDGTYWEDFNYAMMPTEPGSTFKLVTLLSLLNDKYVTINKMIDPEGGIKQFGGRMMRDAHASHTMTIKEAFAHSSNVSMAKLASQYYGNQPSKYTDHIKALYLDKKTGIDLIGERAPTVKTPANRSWSATSLPWMATGYEVSITPLHTCMMYNAIANNGKMMKPYLVSAIREYGKDVRTIEPKVLIDHVGDSAAIAQLKECMEAVVTEGTAKNIASPYYAIAGKTGTAQVSDGAIKYSDGVYQGSFVGFFPADKPKYTIAVVIRTKAHSSAYYGNAIAAPVFKMIADGVFAYDIGVWNGPLDSLTKVGDKNLPAKDASVKNYAILMNALGRKATIPQTWDNNMMKVVVDSNKKTTIVSSNVYQGSMPDVKGMGLKDAIYILENQGLKVVVLGKGKVVAQSVAPGTKIIKGQNIILQLS